MARIEKVLAERDGLGDAKNAKEIPTGTLGTARRLGFGAVEAQASALL